MKNTHVVTAKQMKQIEKNAADSGLSYYQMMENAGSAAVDFIKKQIDDTKTRILIFCGKGNNGGDGFVVARLLQNSGYAVQAVLVDGEPVTEDAQKNFILAKEMQITFVLLKDALKDSANTDADVVVDAIYGTGFHGELREKARQASIFINKMAAKDKPVFALDMPSGINSDTGIADPDAVQAAYTIAFDSLKLAHQMPEARSYCGEVVCVNIGIADRCHNVF